MLIYWCLVCHCAYSCYMTVWHRLWRQISFLYLRRADRQPEDQNDRVCSCNFKEGKKEGATVDFAWNNSKFIDFPDPEIKTGRVTKVLFSDNRAYVLRSSQIYCFEMNFVQLYLLVVMNFKKSRCTMFIWLDALVNITSI